MQMVKRGGKWISAATAKGKGAFRAKAHKAGMPTSEYAAKVTAKGSKASSKTKREANLAKTLGKLRRKK